LIENEATKNGDVVLWGNGTTCKHVMFQYEGDHPTIKKTIDP
jgi:hypothetical protein